MISMTLSKSLRRGAMETSECSMAESTLSSPLALASSNPGEDRRSSRLAPFSAATSWAEARKG